MKKKKELRRKKNKARRRGRGRVREGWMRRQRDKNPGGRRP